MNYHISNGMKLSVMLLFTGLIFVTWSCGSTDSEADEGPEPEPTGEAVWSFLEQENYQNTWSLWPGTVELYDGGTAHMEPFLMTTYLNDVAMESITNGNGSFSDGSMIVKETYVPADSTFQDVTAMYKVDGYNPDANDWFWLMASPEGMIGAEGRVQMCIDCHASASDSDYVFQD
jgi:hypothetical protein